VRNTLYSVADASKILQVDPSTIRRACAKHDIGVQVPNWVLTKADIAKLRKVVRKSKGNPNFTKGNHFGKPPKSEPKPARRKQPGEQHDQ
jgi:hypothetical protein